VRRVGPSAVRGPCTLVHVPRRRRAGAHSTESGAAVAGSCPRFRRRAGPSHAVRGRIPRATATRDVDERGRDTVTAHGQANGDAIRLRLRRRLRLRLWPWAGVGGRDAAGGRA
jgi:hypothetical protein